jgi:hypothetical protein
MQTGPIFAETVAGIQRILADDLDPAKKSTSRLRTT